MNWDQKPIYIIGYGAIGKTVAVFLKRAGKQVTLIRGSVNDGSKKTETLYVEMTDGSKVQAALDIATLSAFTEMDGILVLANKSFGNDQLAKALKDKSGGSPLVLLQNGLGVEQSFIHQQFPEVYRCVLFNTSQVIDRTTVRFKPVAISPVGIERGNPANLSAIVAALNTAEFRFRAETSIQPIIWKKAIANCVFNSVCPLLETDNGIFHRNPAALQIARRVIAECVAIAAETGVQLTVKEVEEALLQISRLADGQEISTLQDIRNKRRTEIDTLNPEIARIAARLNKADWVTETRLLGELTKIKAEINLQP